MSGSMMSWYCPDCGYYHANETGGCPRFSVVTSEMPPTARVTPIFPNRDAELLAALERIEGLLRQLVSTDGGQQDDTETA